MEQYPASKNTFFWTFSAHNKAMKEPEWALKVMTGEVEAVERGFDTAKVFAADAAFEMLEKDRIYLTSE
jgi:hypothetical protein